MSPAQEESGENPHLPHESRESAGFHTTRWTQVHAARGPSTEAQSALASLCEAYYAPVEAYIAQTTRDLGEPRELTQEFFARILSGASLAGAEPGRGRFRAYLLGAVKNFLSDTRQRRHTAKRGDGWQRVSIHPGSGTETGFDLPASPDRTPDAWFDRCWGLALLQRGLDALEAEYGARGNPAHFAFLKPWLTGEALNQSQAELASQLAMSEGAVKVAIHRLRKRFREIIQAQILDTVTTEDEMREELRYLIQVVS